VVAASFKPATTGRGKSRSKISFSYTIMEHCFLPFARFKASRSS
jgi:hypothetical protein